MFNIQPGQGLGFSASKEIALGLGSAVAEKLRREILRLASYIRKVISLKSEL